MAVEVHLAELAYLNVLPDGRVVRRGTELNLPINAMLKFDTEFRVIADSTNPNTTDEPNIREYLEREASSGFEPVQILQTMIITKKVT
jgi:hypothetical protein